MGTFINMTPPPESRSHEEFCAENINHFHTRQWTSPPGIRYTTSTATTTNNTADTVTDISSWWRWSWWSWWCCSRISCCSYIYCHKWLG
jgi:hypothetical protein